MVFEQMGDGGEKETDWYYWVVVDIVNPKKGVLKIEQDDERLHEWDAKITKQKLNVSMWNMKKQRREHDVSTYRKNDLMINNYLCFN